MRGSCILVENSVWGETRVGGENQGGPGGWKEKTFVCVVAS